MDDKNKLDEAASLNINVNEDGVSHNYTWAAEDLDQLSQLLRMSGIDGTKQVTNAILTADSGTGPVSFRGESSSANMAKIMAIIDGPQAVAAVIEPVAMIGGDCACESIEQVDEAQAAHDYGKNPTSRKGFEYDIEPADFQGRAGMPNRLVNNYGDNAMDNSDVTETKKSFDDYLREAEIKSAAKTKFVVTIEQVQFGYWGTTTLKSKDVVISAPSEEEAKKIIYSKLDNMPRQRLANGDSKAWQFVHIKPQ